MLFNDNKEVKSLSKFIYVHLALGPLAFVFAFFLLKFYIGPYWECNDFDPEYTYLLNGLSRSLNRPVGHVDHPGVPLQNFISYFLTAYKKIKSFNNEELIRHVLLTPSWYSTACVLLVFGINMCLLYCANLVLYSKTHNKKASIIYQFFPLCSIFLVIYCTNRLASEILVFTADIVLASSLILFLYGKEKSWLTLSIMSIAIGFGTAEKLTFMPALIIPILLADGMRKKIAMATLCMLAFVVFGYPTSFRLEYYEYISEAIANIYKSNPKYGSLIMPKLTPMRILFNLITILQFDFVYAITLFTSTYFTVFKRNLFSRLTNGQDAYKLLWVILLFQWINIASISLALPMPQYTAPGLGLMGINMLILLDLAIVLQRENLFYRIYWGLLIANLIFILWVCSWFVPSRIGLKDREAVSSILKHYPDYAKIFYYRSSQDGYQLGIANAYTTLNHDGIYGDQIAELYPNRIYCNVFIHQYFVDNRVVDIDTILPKYNGKILYIGTTPANYEKINGDDMEVFGRATLPFTTGKKIYEGEMESITLQTP
jgi:hypothetical protein